MSCPQRGRIAGLKGRAFLGGHASPTYITEKRGGPSSKCFRVVSWLAKTALDCLEEASSSLSC